MIDIKHYKWSPSLIAATALYIAHKILKRSHPWSPELQENSDFTETQIRACAKELCVYYNFACECKRGYEILNKKFSLAKFFEVAKITVVNRDSQNKIQHQNNVNYNNNIQ